MTIDRRTMIRSSLAMGAVTGLSGATMAASGPLSGKSILITGASSGFGRMGALLYARQGAKVIATMRNMPRPEATSLAAEAKAERLDITILEIDVTSDASVAKGVAQAEKIANGAIDILINNAGVVMGGPVELHDMEATKLGFDTNVFGVQRMLRAVLPTMRARKSGLIFNVSSQQGRFVIPGGGLYASTKFALEALSEQLAYELVPHGIEVVIIQPGGFPTNVGKNRAKYNAQIIARSTPRHAVGYPAMIEQMKRPPGAPGGPMPAGLPDPMLVPTAIAEIAAMAAGTRPLRRPVHPGNKPQIEINRVSRETQLKLMESGPYAPWAKAVLD